MEKVIKNIKENISIFLEKKYSKKDINIVIIKTKKGQIGDISLLLPQLPNIQSIEKVVLAKEIGNHLLSKSSLISSFEIKGSFLNILISDSFFLKVFNDIKDFNVFGTKNKIRDKIMLEYSSPNTNKPLHLGHVRNNLIGYSVSKILEANGKEVIKTQIINDRGIHICKSMLAWELFGNGETPQSTNTKGDKFVGDYYVRFNTEHNKEIDLLKSQGKTDESIKKESTPLLKSTQEMLIKWENGNKEILDLWNKMNGWVYDGFEVTYDKLGVSFDKLYYESNTYLKGKEIILKGLSDGIFEKDEDGSIWVDLTKEGLDKKVLLRGDGTSLYITQDIGTAVQRSNDFNNINGMIYTVGNEQDYHFKVLFEVLKKLGYEWSNNLRHLSYGMVELPDGRMKGREGTVVEADDLIQEMYEESVKATPDLKDDILYHQIGLGALKYHLLKVNSKKTVLFDPKKSLDFQGNTGTFIQYTHVRINSLIKKCGIDLSNISYTYNKLESKEKDLLKIIMEFENTIEKSSNELNPSIVCNYVYEISKTFSSFYHDHHIITEENLNSKMFKLKLSELTGIIIKKCLDMLGIEIPSKM